MLHFHFLGSTGLVGRIPPGIKEFLAKPTIPGSQGQASSTQHTLY